MRYYVWETSQELRNEYESYTTKDGRTVPNDVFRSDGYPVLWTQDFAEGPDGQIENTNLRLATEEEIAEGITTEEVWRKSHEEECQEKKKLENLS